MKDAPDGLSCALEIGDRHSARDMGPFAQYVVETCVMGKQSAKILRLIYAYIVIHFTARAAGVFYTPDYRPGA
jgi:hypothetical protein